MNEVQPSKKAICKVIKKIAAREVKKQKIVVLRANKKVINNITSVLHEVKQYGMPQKFVCKKLPHNIGCGIFLHPEAEPIKKGDIVAQYDGEFTILPQNLDDDSVYAFGLINDIILSKEEQAYLDPKRKYHPRRKYSLNLDALNVGNFTRYINHSEKPNLDAELYTVPVNSLGLEDRPIDVVYVANKIIRPGEQLLVSYEGDNGNSYWGPLKIKPMHITPKTFMISPSLQVIEKKIK